LKVYRANKNIFKNILLAAEDRTAQRSIDERGLNWCGERDFRPLLLVNPARKRQIYELIIVLHQKIDTNHRYPVAHLLAK